VQKLPAMPTACLNTPGHRLRLASARLEVHGRHPGTGNECCLRQIPLHDLDRLLVHEGVQITSEALAEVLRRSIPVVIMAHEGRSLGHFTPTGNAHGTWRLRQYQRTLEPQFVLSHAGRIVAAKLYNQRRVLQRQPFVGVLVEEPRYLAFEPAACCLTGLRRLGGDVVAWCSYS
jgi:CRISPR/Cas system-associated endonuclease Cas1